MADVHARQWLPAYAKPDLWLDEHNALEFVRWQDDTAPYMALWWHRSPPSETGWCVGSFAWRRPSEQLREGPLWDVQSWEPLSVSPSLLCLACGAHGYIEQSTWRPV